MFVFSENKSTVQLVSCLLSFISFMCVCVCMHVCVTVCVCVCLYLFGCLCVGVGVMCSVLLLMIVLLQPPPSIPTPAQSLPPKMNLPPEILILLQPMHILVLKTTFMFEHYM